MMHLPKANIIKKRTFVSRQKCVFCWRRVWDSEPSLDARFARMLEDILSDVPDTLTVDEVVELTGYSRKTILRYAQRKYIYAVNIMGKYYISKQSIINYPATDKAFKNTQKSEWHVNIICLYSKERKQFS